MDSPVNETWASSWSSWANDIIAMGAEKAYKMCIIYFQKNSISEKNVLSKLEKASAETITESDVIFLRGTIEYYKDNLPGLEKFFDNTLATQNVAALAKLSATTLDENESKYPDIRNYYVQRAGKSPSIKEVADKFSVSAPTVKKYLVDECWDDQRIVYWKYIGTININDVIDMMGYSVNAMFLEEFHNLNIAIDKTMDFIRTGSVRKRFISPGTNREVVWDKPMDPASMKAAVDTLTKLQEKKRELFGLTKKYMEQNMPKSMGVGQKRSFSIDDMEEMSDEKLMELSQKVNKKQIEKGQIINA